MGKRITVKFKKDHIEARGAGIAGAKGSVQTYPVTDQLKDLIKAGVLEPVKKAPAERRKKATGAKDKEKA